ncbi:TetR/AcrR family transcriptional regulator [Sulfitobacter sabulilitoris]|uniref:TetR/AcrR family transcriptional regulator n=1 Tax=Sulfitobacter sabulilitoris TaxID=2562655 RepID=A0A5S3PCZ5_9RHOB|nr:TetR/AcrR family transcriptional regulator [Sulfitobacter sabulilitoris]TMM51734.1 TetR/AcrR family transcriptional regulator [Sulfitobacter sabulilitoris]
MVIAKKPMKIREEVAALKRERTLDTAVDLFYEKGYVNATLDDVADRLSVTKPFIYANFGSKNELLSEICLRGVMAAKQALDDVLEFDLGPGETLRLFITRYVAAILEHQKNIAVYTREEKNLGTAEAQKLAALRKAFVAKLTSILEQGVASGEFDVRDPNMAALAIIGSVSWSTFWYHPDGRLTIADITQNMTHLLMGLAGLKRA